MDVHQVGGTLVPGEDIDPVLMDQEVVPLEPGTGGGTVEGPGVSPGVVELQNVLGGNLERAADLCPDVFPVDPGVKKLRGCRKMIDSSLSSFAFD